MIASPSSRRGGLARIAGILNIIAGVAIVSGMLFGSYLIWALIKAFTMPSSTRGSDALVMTALITVPGVIIGSFAIAGGVVAGRRHRWRLALAGSIRAAIGVFFLGIPSIILLIMGKREFA